MQSMQHRSHDRDFFSVPSVTEIDGRGAFQLATGMVGADRAHDTRFPHLSWNNENT